MIYLSRHVDRRLRHNIDPLSSEINEILENLYSLWIHSDTKLNLTSIDKLTRTPSNVRKGHHAGQPIGNRTPNPNDLSTHRSRPQNIKLRQESRSHNTSRTTTPIEMGGNHHTSMSLSQPVFNVKPNSPSLPNGRQFLLFSHKKFL